MLALADFMFLGYNRWPWGPGSLSVLLMQEEEGGRPMLGEEAEASCHRLGARGSPSLECERSTPWDGAEDLASTSQCLVSTPRDIEFTQSSAGFINKLYYSQGTEDGRNGQDKGKNHFWARLWGTRVR